jgi:hypothetical protein
MSCENKLEAAMGELNLLAKELHKYQVERERLEGVIALRQREIQNLRDLCKLRRQRF